MPIFVGPNNNDSEIKSDRIGFAVSTTNPGSAAEGDSYFNSGDKQLKVYNGSDWDSVGAGGGTVEAVASGTLANGQTVILQSDGTVTAVTTTGIAQTSGTATTFQSNTVGLSPQSVVYDSYNKRIVILFKEGTRGYAVVGTVNANNNTISFGSITEFEGNNGTTYFGTFDSTNNRVVIAFYQSTDSDRGKNCAWKCQS